MRSYLLVLLIVCEAAGQQLRVDVTRARRPINPDIYGINEYGVPAQPKYPFTLRRWGGDNSVSYNWQLDANNLAGNWYFETFPIDNNASESSFDRWVARNQAEGRRSVATVPIIGWTTATRKAKNCSYSVAKYGPQQQTDIYAPDCGNGMSADGKRAIVNDPNDVYIPAGPHFAYEWVNHVKERFGSTAQGGVWLWELDNEPTWWHAVHRDIHPQPATFDEMLRRNIRWATAIKTADPTAKVGGATPPGWESYFYSAKDLYAGWGTGPDYKYWNNPTDCKEHFANNVCGGFLPWYLSQMRALENETGTRLIDYLDIHAYIAPDNLSGNYQKSNPAADRLRLTSTRAFWDANYMPPREDMRGMQAKWGSGNPQLIPRMRRWIDENYPGTLLAITEYNWGAPEHITGALVQADLLGIFGREGVDLATLWGTPTAGQPAAFVWKLLLDYDGQGHAFGDTSVLAESSNPDEISIFAAERDDGALTILLLNKTTAQRSAAIDLANWKQSAVETFRFSEADLTQIRKQPDFATDGANIAMEVPAYSLTLLVLKPNI